MEKDPHRAEEATPVAGDLGVGRMLVVDDDASILRMYVRVLTHAGFAVQTATDGEEAMRAIQREPFDAVLSDISMPGMDGIQLLREIRARDLDVPVVMVTGEPAIESAIRAMEFGALRYVVKPIGADELVQTAKHAVQLHRIALIKRSSLQLLGGMDKLVGDRAGLESRFTSALRTSWMAFQPIVSWSRRETFGYEALLRSVEPSLPNPDAMIDAAERLGQIHALGRVARAGAVAPMEGLPADVSLFVNLHARDLLDEELFSPDAPLSRVARRVVLELTERESLRDVADVPRRVAALRRLGFRIAIDDVGAGYAGLTSFALLEPDVVKIDMSLVRDIDTSSTKRRLVGGLAALCADLKIQVVAEGIETNAEREAVVDQGVDLLQGYLFARPGRPFPAAAFATSDGAPVVDTR